MDDTNKQNDDLDLVNHEPTIITPTVNQQPADTSSTPQEPQTPQAPQSNVLSTSTPDTYAQNIPTQPFVNPASQQATADSIPSQELSTPTLTQPTVSVIATPNTPIQNPPTEPVNTPSYPIQNNFTDTSNQLQTVQSNQLSVSNKKSKKLFFMIPIVLILIIGAVAAFITLRPTPTTNVALDSNTIFSIDELNRLDLRSIGYSSPFGLLPPFQSNNVTSGKYTLKANPLIPAELNNDFVVSDTGSIHLKTINNIDKINKFISFLYLKGADESTETDQELASNISIKANQFSELSFSNLAGYSFLSDPNDLFGGFFAATDSAFNNPDALDDTVLAIASDQCRTNYESLKNKLSSDHLNTKNFNATYVEDGEFIKIELDQSPINETNTAMFTYFDSCFDFTKASLVEYADLIEKYKSNPPKLPTFRFKQEAADWVLVIAGPDSRSTANLEFKLSDLNADETLDDIEDTGSLTSRNNLFGIAYDSCRVPPTKASDFGGSKYEFVAESSGYIAPSNFDSGYFCTPSSAEGYSSSDSIYIQTQDFALTARGASIDQFKVATESRYIAERYFVENGHYPQFSYVQEEVAKIPELGVFATSLLTDGNITYEAVPAGCLTDCSDFTLVNIIRDEASGATIQFISDSYEHQ